MGWLKKRHGFEVNYEHLAFAPPGVIYAMNVVLRILTKPGDRSWYPCPTTTRCLTWSPGAAGSW